MEDFILRRANITAELMEYNVLKLAKYIEMPNQESLAVEIGSKSDCNKI